MKIATVFLVLAAVVLGYIAFNTEGPKSSTWARPIGEQLSADVPAGYEVLRFHVEGMCCESCPTKLREQLALVEGVVDSAVSFSASQAEAVVPVGFDATPLLSVLNQDKYTAQIAP